ncbi:Ubiquitin carboxyl-terminal hydrolase 34 [Ceratocystis lukuohia]|uniref:Ubiquitin carboxyl-terminal hydrolase 34 n=1 Tax=Ceratocystis lukuohia TaxID=2019550 RepID=A0ABR4MDR4_9PEZI
MATLPSGHGQISDQGPDACGPSSSPETSSTRLNPFADTESARKRRRMHGSASHSLSEDSDSEIGSRSTEKTPQTSSTPDPVSRQSPILLSTGDLPISRPSGIPSPHANDSPQQPTIIMSDHETQTPSSPVQISPTSLCSINTDRPETPIGAPSNRVTINIRPTTANAQSSSPSLPLIDHSQEGEDPHLIEADPSASIKNSVELDGDVEMISNENDLDSPRLDLDIDSDDDILHADATSIIPDIPTIVFDPTNDFPYCENQNHGENISRVCEFLAYGTEVVDESLFEALSQWVDNWVIWAKGSNMTLVIQSMSNNQSLWTSFPEIVWSFVNRNCTFLTPLSMAIRKMEEIASLGGRPLSTDASSIIWRFALMDDTSPTCLKNYLIATEELAPRFPKILDTLTGICSVVSLISETAIAQLDQDGLNILDVSTCLEECHHFHTIAVRITEKAIESYTSHLTPEGFLTSVSRLDGILRSCLTGSHPNALSVKEKFATEFPTIPAQLRVSAANTFCLTLVSVWRKYGDQPDEVSPVVLEFMAHQVCECGVLDYILNATCHPEVSTECYNIVGFLAITRFYSEKHLDQAWNTLSTCQDPRVTESLLKLLGRVLELFEYSVVVTHCQKLIHLPLENFANPSFKSFADAVVKAIISRKPSNTQLTHLPFDLCLRLLRESTSASMPSEYRNLAEVHQLACAKLRELFHNEPDASARSFFYADCLKDIRSKSRTSIGSLWGVYIALKSSAVIPELHDLAANHDFGKIIVDELDHAMRNNQNALSGPCNVARQELIYLMILHEPSVFDGKLGARLWDLLVGSRVASDDARRSGWSVINSATRHDISSMNPFLKCCFDSQLSILPAYCLCEGSLEFIKLKLLPRLSGQDNLNDVQLDDEDSVLSSGIENLWRVILLSPNEAVAKAATCTLAKDIYTESSSILSYPHHRARQVHLLLLTRCMQQLEKSATEMRKLEGKSRESPAISSSSKDAALAVDAELVIPDKEQDHERTFLRTLCVLTTFMEFYKNKPRFSTPDIWPLIPSRPSSPNGGRVGLKVQTFDQGRCSEIKPIEIGALNTVGCLLTLVRKVSGFDNYRMYYGGQRFSPSETNIRMTLEDLKMHQGLILVKREDRKSPAPSGSCPGASLLEIELLSQFKQFWDYLDFPNHIAEKIYNLLVKFPADSSVVSKLLDVNTKSLDVFPPSQPFKSLYALFAIGGMTDINRIGRLHFLEGGKGNIDEIYVKSLTKALKLVSEAIDSPQILDMSQPHMARLDLATKTTDATIITDVKPPSASRFIDILSNASIQAESRDIDYDFIFGTIRAVFELSSEGDDLWLPLSKEDKFVNMLVRLLTNSMPFIRHGIINIIDERVGEAVNRNSHNVRICQYLWPIVADIISIMAQQSTPFNEIFRLAESLLLSLSSLPDKSIDVGDFAKTCIELLLAHNTVEEIGTEHIDFMALGIVKLVLCSLKIQPDIFNNRVNAGFAQKLFWKLLFPREPSCADSTVQKVLITPGIRSRLYNILHTIATTNQEERLSLLQCLSDVAPLDVNSDYSLYCYDLHPQFDRSKVIRASCGYVGLRNLSNTCYLNSLFTQLFMNVKFRELMLKATISDESEQRLLNNTQRLFGNMQNSMARFVDPSAVISSIKTYDEGPIDINNQMDVDEFYNLLFDRFESQMANPQERKQVRSFFGGQIVQQVKSLECEHVSERMEPFSAIQCDIKGKATLVDSLQAYVDGELLDGDNKYKCSTCDRHVSAVKRACFQDMPNNLIFHLKRFDFNLRTLQRSKINDHFSFPKTIDMNPYTVAHLSSPEKSLEPDTFELVGVLVHSGTAESGHYYSYIKDRTSEPGTNKWFEFNDDLVTPWDPNQMESSTYGGLETRMPYENNSGPFEKSYSAYMLFYQRVSNLKEQQNHLAAKGLSLPVKVGVPADISLSIRDENFLILRRHCLYDSGHVQFVAKMFNQTQAHHSTGPRSSHGEQKTGMGILLSHLDQVVSRVKGLPDFSEYESIINNAIYKCPECAMNFFQHFAYYKESFRVMLQRSPELCVRQDIGLMMLNALQILKKERPFAYHPRGSGCEDASACVLHSMLDILGHTWQAFHTCIRAWDEYFQFILSFAKMGDLETAHLLAEDYLVQFTQIVTVDQALQLTPQFSRLLNMMTRRAASLKPVCLQYVFLIIEHFLNSLSPKFSQDHIVDDPRERLSWLAENGRPLPWSSTEVNAFHETFPYNTSNLFMAKICSYGQSPQLVERIIQRLTCAGPLMETHLMTTLQDGINGGFTHHRIAPYMRCAIWFCAESQNVERIVEMISFVSKQAINIQSIEGKIFPVFFKAIHQNALMRLQHDRTAGFGILNAVLDSTKIWAPWLLCYNQNSSPAETRVLTEDFLITALFHYGCPPKVPENEGGEEIADMIRETVRQLGILCLQYINSNVIDTKTQVSRESMSAIQQTIARCSNYFDAASSEVEDCFFYNMGQNILDILQSFLVDQLEEEASGMFTSSDTYSDVEEDY